MFQVTANLKEERNDGWTMEQRTTEEWTTLPEAFHCAATLARPDVSSSSVTKSDGAQVYASLKKRKPAPLASFYYFEEDDTPFMRRITNPSLLSSIVPYVPRRLIIEEEVVNLEHDGLPVVPPGFSEQSVKRLLHQSRHSSLEWESEYQLLKTLENRLADIVYFKGNNRKVIGNIRTWHLPMQAMIKEDKITPERINEVLDFFARSSDSRIPQIRTSKTLRKHFVLLEWLMHEQSFDRCRKITNKTSSSPSHSQSTASEHALPTHQHQETRKFAVQKANTFDGLKDYGVDQWLASPKLDGVRCIYINGQLYTRTGKAIHGFDHILQECRDLQQRLDVNVIDGELYSHHFSFQDIQGCVTRNRKTDDGAKSQLGFHVFAVTNRSECQTQTTQRMYELLKEIQGSYTYIMIVPCVWVRNKSSDIRKLRDSYTAEGYEGIMLRHPTIAYEWKRSDALLKYKLVKEDDFRVVGCFEGKGKCKGKLGGLYVEKDSVLSDNTEIKLCAEVGTGFTDEQRERLWQNIDQLKGAVVEIAYQEVTSKPKDQEKDGLAVYSVRCPVFRKFKEDR